MGRLRIALVAITALTALGVAQAQEATEFNFIQTRQAGQDLLAGTFAGIVQGVKQKAPVKPFADPAAAMARWMKQYPTTFPPGSDKGPTKALPAVWTDRAGFDKAAANLVQATEKLSALAKASDTEGFDAQVKVVADACKACHDKFRAK